MELKNFAELLKSNTYPGRGIMIGKTEHTALFPILLWEEAKTAVTVYL